MENTEIKITAGASAPPTVEIRTADTPAGAGPGAELEIHTTPRGEPGPKGDPGEPGGGGGDVFYTNPVPTPETIGGIKAGSTFLNETVKEMFDALLYPYQVPSFSSFWVPGQPTSIEVGNTVPANRNFSWATVNPGNVQPNSLSIRDVTGGVLIADGLADDGMELTASPAVQKVAQASHIWGIGGLNTKGAAFTRNWTVSWYWRKHYGSNAAAGPLDEAAIKALAAFVVSGGFAGVYACNGPGYKYICYPAVLGLATIFKDTLTGFNVPFEASYLVAVTNVFGVTTDYRVHRSTNSLGADVSIQVS